MRDRAVAVAAIAGWALALWVVARAPRADRFAAWRASPQAGFARSRRATLIAQEWAPETVAPA